MCGLVDETKAASFTGPKANAGAVVMTTSKAGIKLSLTDDFKATEPVYGKFDFASQTRWSKLVHGLARSE